MSPTASAPTRTGRWVCQRRRCSLTSPSALRVHTQSGVVGQGVMVKVIEALVGSRLAGEDEVAAGVEDGVAAVQVVAEEDRAVRG